MQSEPLKTWKLGIITSHGIPNPKSQVPTMTWMPTWQHFLEMRPGTCVASWVVQKARPNSQPTSREFLHKTIKIRLLYHLTIFYWFWGPCLHYWDLLTWVELGTHVNPVPWTLKFISLYLTEAATLLPLKKISPLYRVSMFDTTPSGCSSLHNSFRHTSLRNWKGNQ